VSFEPPASDRWFIERHLSWNGVTHVTLLQRIPDIIDAYQAETY
jgi:hypothetical protein